MAASPGADGSIIEAFKPGTGPSDQYQVIGGTYASAPAQQSISPEAAQAIASGAGGLF
jgi:penicillin-binding protein 1A